MSISKQKVEISFMIVLLALFFLPMWELQYRYVWDITSGPNDTGIFKNLKSIIFDDHENLTVYGHQIKFPVAYVGLLVQLLFLVKEGIPIKYSIGLYIGVIFFYGICFNVFLNSFDHHHLEKHLKIGSYAFFILMILGILKELVFLPETKPSKNNTI